MKHTGGTGGGRQRSDLEIRSAPDADGWLMGETSGMAINAVFDVIRSMSAGHSVTYITVKSGFNPSSFFTACTVLAAVTGAHDHVSCGFAESYGLWPKLR